MPAPNPYFQDRCDAPSVRHVANGVTRSVSRVRGTLQCFPIIKSFHSPSGHEPMGTTVHVCPLFPDKKARHSPAQAAAAVSGERHFQSGLTGQKFQDDNGVCSAPPGSPCRRAVMTLNLPFTYNIQRPLFAGRTLITTLLNWSWMETEVAF